MDVVDFCDFCNSLPNVDESLPFGDSTLVYKVGGRMFAAIGLDHPDHFVVKCDPIDHSGIFPFKSVAKIGIFSLSCIVSGQKNAKKKTFYTCALNINKLHENNKIYLIDAWIKPAVMIAPGITTNIPIISGTFAK